MKITSEDRVEIERWLSKGTPDKRTCKELNKILGRYESAPYSCMCDPEERRSFWYRFMAWWELNKENE